MQLMILMKIIVQLSCVYCPALQCTCINTGNLCMLSVLSSIDWKTKHYSDADEDEDDDDDNIDSLETYRLRRATGGRQK